MYLMDSIEPEYLTGMPHGLIFRIPEKETAITNSELELNYQTPFRRIYCDKLINIIYSLYQKNLNALLSKPLPSIDYLRFHRILLNVNATIWKFKNLPNFSQANQPHMELYSTAAAINENNSLLLSIKRTIDGLLQISKNEKDFDIGKILSKRKDSDSYQIGILNIDSDDFLMFKTINICANCTKHSILYEDYHPMLCIGPDRFFGTENLLIDDFDKKFKPSNDNKYFSWGLEEISSLEMLFSKPRDKISFEYNIAIAQVMVTYLLFIIKNIMNISSHFFHPDMTIKNETLPR